MRARACVGMCMGLYRAALSASTEDEEKKKEKHISRHLYGNFISTHV